MKESSKLTDKYLKLLAEQEPHFLNEKPDVKYKSKADAAKLARRRKCK